MLKQTKKSKSNLTFYRWKSLLILLSSGIITIGLPLVILFQITNAAAYRPPQPPAPHDDGPPPPEEDHNPPEDKGPPPTKAPTPTPCIPNWCFIEQSECCFDPICVMFSDKDAAKRCPKPKKEDLKFLDPNAAEGKNLIQTVLDFVRVKMGF